MKQLLVIFLFCLLINSSCLLNQKEGNIVNSTSTVELTNSEIGGNIQILPSADTLSVALTLFRKGKQMPAESSNIFFEKDGIRLNISVVEKGYLAILYEGSDGNDAQVIFPNKDFYKGKSMINPNENLLIPTEGWFFLDKKAGIERIFVVYSKTQKLKEFTNNPKEMIKSIAKQRSNQKEVDAFLTEDGYLVRVIELKHQ